MSTESQNENQTIVSTSGASRDNKSPKYEQPLCPNEKLHLFQQAQKSEAADPMQDDGSHHDNMPAGN